MTTRTQDMPYGLSRPERTWYNANDGHTYWLDDDGDLVAAATNVNGEPDWLCSAYVDDFYEPLTQLEKTSIIERLLAD